ncbi:hypothetical protein ACHAXT_008207 [Thalassiosira profunda]
MKSPTPRCSPLYAVALVALSLSPPWAPEGGIFASAFSASTDASSSTKPPLDGAPATKTKRIAIVGAGAVGSYYGGRLWEGTRAQDDVDVMFHLRGEHFEHCSKNGIDVSSYHGDFSIPAEELLAFPTTEDMAGSADDGGFDWVVCALKSTSLDKVPELIGPLMSPETRLLVIMNGLIEDDLIEMLRKDREAKGLEGVGCKAIYGGMALICSNRLSPGKISHTYGGKLVCGVAYSADAEGDDGTWVESDKQAILDLFEPATAVPFEYEPNLRRGRWWKNVWNLPFSGISVSMGGITVDRIVQDPSLRKLAYKVIDETIEVANADLLKHECSEDELLGEETRDEMMTLSDQMGPYKPSTMLDMHARKPMEVTYLFRRAVDRADDLGVSVPHLESIVSHIEAHQRHHNLF